MALPRARSGDFALDRSTLVSPAALRRELRRLLAVTPVAFLVGGSTFTLLAATSGLPEPYLNFVALPAVALPSALAGIVAEYRLGRVVLSRVPAHPMLALAGLRWVGTVAVLVPLVWLLAPLLVGRAWWWWLPLALPSGSAALGALVLVAITMYDRLYYRLQAAFADLERRRELERFLPAEAVERVLAGDTLALAGERRVVTVLFADLRGSTALAESLPAERVVEVLNSYIGAMARGVFEEGGMLDKFLGDGVMAIFGAIGADPSEGAVPAVRAALSMRARLAALNAERTSRGERLIGAGIGIHTGEVVLGAVGIPERQDYTAIGDTVNTASRVEGLCKTYGVDCVLTSETASRLDPARYPTRPLGRVPVRGKSEPIEVLALL